MCGITAIYSYHSEASPVDENLLCNMRDAMLSRGPDGEGLWISDDKRIGLAHRRLSIIGLGDQGKQPMSTSNQRYYITYNGEIYNYQSLRSELEKKSYRFKTQTDTEVLLYLYQEYGAAMLSHLRGMFAFCIWDSEKRGLFLARDPFGIKPLYYSDNGCQLIIASQVKALLKNNSINTEIEPAGHVGYFLLGHVPEPYTLYKGIRALPAGHSLWVDQNGVEKPKAYYSVRDNLLAAQQFKSTDSLLTLKDALKNTVSAHMVSDVPVGVFLSSGIDSALITALASEHVEQPLQTVTLGFQEYQNSNKDETHFAKRISKQYKTEQNTVALSRDEIESELPRFFAAMDQPTIDGANTYFVSKVTAESGLKVALSGVGGDELLGGYNNFQRIPQFVRWCRWAKKMGILSRLMRRVTKPAFKYLGKEKYAGLLEYANTYSGAYFLLRGLQMPFQIFDVMNAETFSEGWEQLQLIDGMKASISGLTDKHLMVSGLELQWYMRNQLLRDTDWAGMAHSLEIRVPFVDVHLFSAVMKVYDQIQSKRQCVRQLNTSLPSMIFDRKKSGFNVPIQAWNGGMRAWANTVYKEFVN